MAECQVELDAVSAAITGATFAGKDPVATTTDLLAKVGAAQAKLAEGKPADAVQKLEDIRVTVVALNTPDAKGKTKIDAAGAAAIIAAVDAAQACIEAQAAPAA